MMTLLCHVPSDIFSTDKWPTAVIWAIKELQGTNADVFLLPKRLIGQSGVQKRGNYGDVVTSLFEFLKSLVQITRSYFYFYFTKFLRWHPRKGDNTKKIILTLVVVFGMMKFPMIGSNDSPWPETLSEYLTSKYLNSPVQSQKFWHFTCNCWTFNSKALSVCT